MNKYFITSDNRKIKLSRKWFNQGMSYKERCQKYHDWVQSVFVDSLKTGHTGVSYKLFPLRDIFQGKAAEAGFTIEHLKKLGLPTHYRSVLDIGSATAIQPRLFKMSGIVDEVWALDKSDQSQVITDNEVRSWLTDMQSGNIVARLMQLRPYKFYPQMFNANGSPTIDNFITDDFVAHKFDRKFDLITAYHFFCYADPKPGIPKAAELLNDDGVLVVMVNNWYDVDAGSACLPMAAPWLHVRVTREDLYRYYQENHTEIYEDICTGIYRPRINVTPWDYIDYAKGTGLKLLDIRYSDYSFLNQDIEDIEVIMNDARMINHHATFNDLCFYFLTMVFKKN